MGNISYNFTISNFSKINLHLIVVALLKCFFVTTQF